MGGNAYDNFNSLIINELNWRAIPWKSVKMKSNICWTNEIE